MMNDGPNIVTNGLVFYVDAGDTTSFRRGNDTTWRDLTTNGVNGAINATTFTTLSQGSFNFNGTSSYINFGTGLSQAGSFTISTWARRTGTQGGVICGRSESAPNYKQNYLLSFNSGTTTIMFSQSENGYKNVTSTLVAANNVWYEITGVYDTTINKMSLYIDGVYENSNYIILTTDPPIGGSQYFLVGASDGTSPANFLRGDVSDIKLYNRPLLDEEIYFNYRVQKTRFGK